MLNADSVPSSWYEKKEKIRSLARSKSYLTLLDLAKSDGQDADSLRLLLVLLNAHPKLTAHTRIFENLSIILDMPPIVKAAASGKLKWGEQIATWKNLCVWVVNNKSKFDQEQNLKGFVYEDPITRAGSPSKDGRHPLNHNGPGFTRHGVCACLFNRHQRNPEFLPIPNPNSPDYQYLCLQAQLLISYVSCRDTYARDEFDHRDSKKIAEMEADDGVEDKPNAPIVTSSVTRAIRQLNQTYYSDLVMQLNTGEAPAVFNTHIQSVTLPPNITAGLLPIDARKLKVEGNRLLDHLKNYFYAVGKSRTRTRKRRNVVIHNTKKNSRALTGYIHVKKGVWIEEFKKDDDEDIGQDPADIVETSDNPDDPDGDDAERSGLSPNENRTPTIKLYDPEELGGAMMRAKYGEMAKRMAAQSFSWDYDVLTSTELRKLWSILNRTISDFISQEKKATLLSEDVQCALMIKIMLLLGQDLKPVRALRINPSINDNFEGIVYHSPINGKPGWWQLESIEPNYRTKMSDEQQRLGRLKAEYLALPDFIGLGNEMALCFQKAGRDLNLAFSPGEKKMPKLIQDMFNKMDEQWVLTEVGPSIRNKRPRKKIAHSIQTRVTLSKIRNALHTRLRSHSGDNAIEWIASAQNKHQNEPRLHYTNLSTQLVTTAYCSAVRRLFKDLGESVTPMMSIDVSVDEYHGARFVASMDSIKNLVSSLKSKLALSVSSYDRTGIIEYHNWFTLHLWLVQSLYTCMRAINNPDSIISVLIKAKQSKNAGLGDKENPELGDKARLVGLPTLLRAQIEIYLDHAEFIKSNLGITQFFKSDKGQEIENLFCLDKNGAPAQVTCGWCEQMMALLDCPLPGNFNRGFLRTELLSRGVSGEVVDSFLGHFNNGESPFYTYSSMDYSQSQKTLQSILDALIKDTGITLLSSRLSR